MNIEQWASFFGRASDDVQLRDAVAKAGVTKPLKLGRNDLSVRADIDGEGTTIVFTDETLFRPDNGVVGRPILSAVLVVVQRTSKDNLYNGPLPHNLKKSDSQTTLRARFGTPTKSNPDNRTDAWLIDGLRLGVSFSEDLGSITKVSLSHPNSR